jgi:hypothetical protein
MITEGLHNKDLEYMVRPVISLDEYISKIDTTAIVVGFYCDDRDSANDLNKFIQRCPINLLDSEVSLSPNAQGEYMVFVEFLNNKNLINELKKVFSHLKNLTNINDWQIRYKTKTYSIDNLQLSETLTYNNIQRFDLIESISYNNKLIMKLKNGYFVLENNIIRKVIK